MGGLNVLLARRRNEVTGVRRRGMGGRAPRAVAGPRVLVFIDLVQDLDVLLPLLIGMRESEGLEQEVIVSRWVLQSASRIRMTLRAHGIGFRTVDRNHVICGRTPSLESVSAVVTATESAADTHIASFVLASRAEARGVPTYTLQHGLEIEWDSHREGASRYLFTWFEQPPEACDHPILVPVGRPWLGAPVVPRFDAGVFENLHWNRYTEAERQAFLDNLTGLAEARPTLSILARSHPAGGWLDAHADRLSHLPNVTFEPSRAARRSMAPGPAVVASARRVITTPSTVALDAAMAGRPVGLACEGGQLYQELPVLRSLSDWIGFCDADVGADRARKAFLQPLMSTGDAVSRIIDRLRGDSSAGREPAQTSSPKAPGLSPA